VGVSGDRLPALAAEDMSAAQRAFLAGRGIDPAARLQGPTRVLIHVPELAPPVSALGELLRASRFGLDPRVQEIAILIVARRRAADYVWFAHVPLALAAGLSRETIAALRDGAAPGDAAEAEVAAFVEALVDGAVADDLYRPLADRLGTAGIIHLATLAGYYGMVATLLAATETHRPADVDDPLRILQPLHRDRSPQ
jgi:4-carboxymuconolactone decarboxylase